MHHKPGGCLLHALGGRVCVCDTLSTSCGGFGSRALARFPQQPPALELVPVQHGAEGLCARGGARGETTAGGRPFARVHQVHTRACVCYPAHSSRMSMPSGVTQARKEKVERWSSLPLFLRTLLAPLPMFVHTSLYDGPAHPVVLTEAITSWPASKVRLLAAGVGCRASSAPPASPLSHPFPPPPLLIACCAVDPGLPCGDLRGCGVHSRPQLLGRAPGVYVRADICYMLPPPRLGGKSLWEWAVVGRGGGFEIRSWYHAPPLAHLIELGSCTWRVPTRSARTVSR